MPHTQASAPATQLFINQVEGRYRVDTRGTAVPGCIPEPIEAAPHLAQRQAERATLSMGGPSVAAAGVGSLAPQKPSRPPHTRITPTTPVAAVMAATKTPWRIVVRDVSSALVMVALITLVLSFGTAGSF